jgi:hypothetical protein
MCNTALQEYGLTVPLSNNITLVTSAYADDVTVFLPKDEGFKHLLHTFMIYGAVSGATLDVQKTTGLFAGRWKNRIDQPLGFRWTNQGERHLGVYLGNPTAWQQQNWTQLEIKVQGILTKLEKFPQATSYQDRKQILNQLVGAKLTHAITVLTPPATFLDKMHRLIVSFVWQGHHWKHPNFVYGRMAGGGIGVQHITTRIKILRFFFLQNFLVHNRPGCTRHFHAWNTATYGQVLHAVDILKLRLDHLRIQSMPPFYATALEAWYNMAPIVNPNIQSIEALRGIPLWNSSLLTPHISGNTLIFDNSWKTLNCAYVGDLLLEDGQWKNIHEFDKTHCTKPTIRRLTANLKKSQLFLRHYYPHLPLKNDHSISAAAHFSIK